MRITAQGTSKGFIWTPADALEIAENFRKVAQAIDAYIERTFDRAPYPVLFEREAWNRFSRSLTDALVVDRTDETEPPDPRPSR